MSRWQGMRQLLLRRMGVPNKRVGVPVGSETGSKRWNEPMHGVLGIFVTLVTMHEQPPVTTSVGF